MNAPGVIVSSFSMYICMYLAKRGKPGLGKPRQGRGLEYTKIYRKPDTNCECGMVFRMYFVCMVDGGSTKYEDLTIKGSH